MTNAFFDLLDDLVVSDTCLEYGASCDLQTHGANGLGPETLEREDRQGRLSTRLDRANSLAVALNMVQSKNSPVNHSARGAKRSAC